MKMIHYYEYHKKEGYGGLRTGYLKEEKPNYVLVEHKTEIVKVMRHQIKEVVV